MKLHVVIPIGVSAPGTPVLSLLEKSISCIQNQTINVKLTVASDTDVSEECKTLLKNMNVNVEWYEPGTFFRRGGIWKKITDNWSKVDSEYVAFLHYDDLWDISKAQLQIEAMEKMNIGCSWSETYVIDGNDTPITSDCARWWEFNKTTLGGRTTAFAHSCIVRKDAFFNSGIMEHEQKWSACFEDIFALYMHSTKGTKVVGAKFFWRNHDMNMTNTLCQWTQPNSQWRDEVLRQQEQGSYKDELVSADHHEVMESAKVFYNKIINTL